MYTRRSKHHAVYLLVSAASVSKTSTPSLSAPFGSRLDQHAVGSRAQQPQKNGASSQQTNRIQPLCHSVDMGVGTVISYAGIGLATPN